MSGTTTHEIPTETYAVDPVHSTIGFGVRINGPGTFRSTVEQFDAQLAGGVLTGSALAESVRITDPNFKAQLLSETFFNTARTPTVTFRSSDIRLAADSAVEVDGDLTIKGVTKRVTATGTFATGDDSFGGQRAFFVLSATVDRREFGLNWQDQLPNGNDALAWDVTLDVDLQFIKQA